MTRRAEVVGRRLGIVALVACALAAGCQTVPDLRRQGWRVNPRGGFTKRISRATKIDLLLAIDSSPSMAAKQALLADAVPGLIARLAHPEFPDVDPVVDLHVAVVSSSLGTPGSDVCGDGAAGHPNDHAHVVAGISAVGHDGCANEGPLESWYRFLIQPDPYKTVVRQDRVRFPSVSLEGIDTELLQERKDFLRPDSLVVVIQLTDKNERTVDPLAFSGHAGPLYEGVDPVAPGTRTCKSWPTDPSCKSCYLADNVTQVECQYDASGMPKTLPADEDGPNLRFFHPMQRFGIDPRFPVSRYVSGLSQGKVPNQDGEHPADSRGNRSRDYQGTPNCTNPLFASSVVVSDDPAALCNLTPGDLRTPDMVFFALIGGAPYELLEDSAGRRKTRLDDMDWTKLLGRDPVGYDFTGVDVHMLESTVPRDHGDDGSGNKFTVSGTPGPWNVPPGEFRGVADDVRTDDLEYACTFLAPDGIPGSRATHLEAAYPPVNALLVAKGLKEQSLFASICPKKTDRAAKASGDPDYGYRPAMHALAWKLQNTLTKRDAACLPDPLRQDDVGAVNCTVVVTLPCDGAGGIGCDQRTACRADLGLKPPPAETVAHLRAQGGAGAVCVLDQFGLTERVGRTAEGSCQGADLPGWCYVPQRPGCGSAIELSRATDPLEASVTVSCPWP